MRKPDLPSPLRDAAEALDRELERYATLAADLKREPATSEKSLRRSARILQGLAETEQLLGQHLGRLVAAIDARRIQQEATTAEVQHLAGGGGADVLLPLDVAAREAPLARAVLMRRPLHHQHLPARVPDHDRGADAHVREMNEPARGAADVVDGVRERRATTRAARPVVGG